MKVLYAGDRKRALWWVGKTVTCPQCGRKVKLEASDESRLTHSTFTKQLPCGMCRGPLFVIHPNYNAKSK